MVGRLPATFLVLFLLPASSGSDVLPQFEDYGSPLYRGALHPPRWIHHDGGEWRDDLDKLVGPPEVNFAGKYFLAVHSCGTGCRYYTLTDLSTGRDIPLPDELNTGDPPPRTAEGQEYWIELFSRPDSRMLIEQDHIDLGQQKEGCRERVFLLEGKKLRPLASIPRGCRKL
jgi:hypothetical protein